ncbi:MAG TPA: YciI-like protein [Kofleriaceae bacterium]|nr:YciI-like protein [Kofleriaceae bacterium]
MSTSVGSIHPAMKHYLLFYETAPDYLERRGAYRDEHLARGWASHQRGELQLGGAFADPPDGAVLVFRAEDRGVVEEFARNDPYVIHGVVVRWRVREWTTVIGDGAMTPVHPKK